MILGYPAPTLIEYGRKLPRNATRYDYMVDRIRGIYNYLENSKNVRSHDFVLIVDGLNTLFQLPPEVTVARYQNILRDNNRRLLKKYGYASMDGRVKDGAQPEIVQKYSQRVLFGALKECIPSPGNITLEMSCLPLPESSLPPDIYGWDTDTHEDREYHRPRFLDPSVMMGQAADLKLIYAAILRFVERYTRSYWGDVLALTRIYGGQEYVRELERRRTASPVKEWLYTQIGISDATNLSSAQLPLKQGERYEYGIGLDYESNIVFNTLRSASDVVFFDYNNVTKSSSAQMNHGVPRERRLLLPTDLSEENIDSPFSTDDHQPPSPTTTKKPLAPGAESETQYKSTTPATHDSESGTKYQLQYKSKLDALPNSHLYSWGDLPLVTNVYAATVPVIIQINQGKPKSSQDSWWSYMWFSPWTRALLRKYTRSSRSQSASQSSLLGGQDWWDTRGGAGGVWTSNEEWIDYGDLCGGYEEDVFADGYGAWGREGEDYGSITGGGGGGGSDKPVYNQWGHLVKGKEKGG